MYVHLNTVKLDLKKKYSVNKHSFFYDCLLCLNSGKFDLSILSNKYKKRNLKKNHWLPIAFRNSILLLLFIPSNICGENCTCGSTVPESWKREIQETKSWHASHRAVVMVAAVKCFFSYFYADRRDAVDERESVGVREREREREREKEENEQFLLGRCSKIA